MAESRLERLIAADPAAARLVERLVMLAVRGLPLMALPSGEYAFSRYASDTGTELRGRSLRYTAIVALGTRFLAEADQYSALGRRTSYDLTGQLVESLDRVTDLGDAALVCWAAAEHAHPDLARALDRLAEVDFDPEAPRPVAEAAWALSALVAAARRYDVADRLTAARRRLLAGRHPRGALFGPATGPGVLPWHRRRVACFADQVYPVQALARLHALYGDPEALDAADACARRVCELQGAAGQWWWHYDAPTGAVVERYPVYSVHQHAMAPMA